MTKTINREHPLLEKPLMNRRTFIKSAMAAIGYASAAGFYGFGSPITWMDELDALPFAEKCGVEDD